MNRALVIKSLWFQSLWFVAVIGREQTLVLLTAAILFTLAYSVRKQEIRMGWLAGFVISGIALDYFNSVLGFFLFPTAFVPNWLIALWVIFIWYAYQMKPVLTLYPIWAVTVVGALGAAGSYFAGLKLGAVEWPLSNSLTFAVVTVEWIILFSVIVTSLGGEKRALS
ncbi:DUF2878 domain-containing protein [Vibrio ishigakensis]|nr:DUF2878 domain-containing protein [Vibrio ishigakensis]